MIEKKDRGERLLEVDNLHCADCGPAPALDAAGKYVGYFENCYGDQWMFIGDPRTGEAVIRGGDIRWATECKVSVTNPYPAELVLGESEKHWIIACFMAMLDRPFSAVAPDFCGGRL